MTEQKPWRALVPGQDIFVPYKSKMDPTIPKGHRLQTAFQKLQELADICRVPDTIVIHAYVRENPDRTLKVYWRDHGNGLRSIVFSRALDKTLDTVSDRRTEIVLVLPHYRFETPLRTVCYQWLSGKRH